MYVEGVTFGDSSEPFCVSVKKKPDLAKLEAFEKCEERIAAGQRGTSNWSSEPSDSLLASVQERIQQAHVHADKSAWRRQIKCARATSSECIFSPAWLFFTLSEHPEHQ